MAQLVKIRLSDQHVFLPEFGALICVECKTAVDGNKTALQNHARHARHGKLNHDTLRKLAEYGCTVTKPRDITIPNSSWQRNAYLHACLAAPQRGYRCRRCSGKGRDYMSVNEGEARRHHRESHCIRDPNKRPRIETGFIYQWVNSGRRWFLPLSKITTAQTTTNPTQPSSVTAEIARIMTGFAASQDAFAMPISTALTGSQDRYSPWQHHTQWIAYFGDRDYSTMRRQTQLSGQPLSDLEIAAMSEFELFFRHSVKLQRGISDRALRVLFSVDADKLDASKFHKPLELGTVTNYIKVWQRFAVWTVRMQQTGKDAAEAEYGFRATADEWLIMDELVDLLSDWSRSEIGNSTALAVRRGHLHSQIIRLVLANAQRQVARKNRGQYLLHCFAAATLMRPPSSFESIGAATKLFAVMAWGIRQCLIQCVYGFGRLERAEKAEQETDMSQLHDRLEVETAKTLFLSQNAVIPVGALFYESLAFGKTLKTDSGREGSIYWQDNFSTLVFGGRTVSLHKVSSMVSQVIARAERALCSLTGLVIDQVETDYPFVDHFNRHDDMYWYGSDYAEPLFAAALEMAASPHLGLLGSKGWHKRECRQWLANVAEFKRDLFFLCHLTGAPPARVADMLTCKKEGLELVSRAVYLHDRRVVLACSSSGKVGAGKIRVGQLRITARYLPANIGRLMRGYLERVARLEDELYKAIFPNDCRDVINDGDGDFSESQPDPAVWRYLWRDGPTRWSHADVLKLMKATTECFLGIAINSRDWRQMAVAIRRQFMPVYNQHRSLDEDQIDWEDGYDEPEDGSRPGFAPGAVSAMNHTHSIELVAYARPMNVLEQLTPVKLSICQAVSTAWQGMPFWHGCFAQAERSLRQRVAGLDKDSRPAKRRYITAAAAAAADNSPPNAARVQQVLQRLSPAGTYKSDTQAEAVEHMLDRPQLLVTVMATGAGKSLLFMMSALLGKESDALAATVVVVPLRALLDDLLVRLRRCNIKAGELTPTVATTLPAAWRRWQCILVSIDQLGTEQVRRQLVKHAKDGRISRVFFDEAHMISTEASYRSCMRHANQATLLDVPLVFLSATLPTSLMDTLREHFYCERAKTRLVRGDLVRRGTTYACNVLDRSEQDEDNDFIGCVAAELMQRVSDPHKTIVYCRTVANVQRLAELLDCKSYYGARENQSATQAALRGKGLALWDAEGGFMIATTALSTGVDVSNVGLVVYAGRPHSMIDFAQGSGRAGRGGEQAMAEVWLGKETDRDEDSSKANSAEKWAGSDEDDAALSLFLGGAVCKRSAMGKYLADRDEDCAALAAAPCDVCQLATVPLPSRLETATAAAAVQMERLRVFLDACYIAGGNVYRCIVCGLLRPGESVNHRWIDCQAFGGENQTAELRNWRNRLNFEHTFDVSFCCGLSQDLCESRGGNDTRCKYWIIARGTVYALYRTEAKNSGRSWTDVMPHMARQASRTVHYENFTISGVQGRLLQELGHLERNLETYQQAGRTYSTPAFAASRAKPVGSRVPFDAYVYNMASDSSTDSEMDRV